MSIILNMQGFCSGCKKNQNNSGEGESSKGLPWTIRFTVNVTWGVEEK